jgi:hypothetical protein
MTQSSNSKNKKKSKNKNKKKLVRSFHSTEVQKGNEWFATFENQTVGNPASYFGALEFESRSGNW